jgi:hypothetical protein
MISKFLTKNKITATSQLTLSSGSANARLLFDRRYDVRWSTSGQTSGTRTIQWIPTEVTAIDSIVIQNCNWGSFHVTYNGGSEFSTVMDFVGNSETDLCLFFDDVNIDTTNGILITITQTMSVEEAKCGELYIGQELFTAGEASQYVPARNEFAFNHQLSDGTTFKVFIRETINYDFEDRAVLSAAWINYFNLVARNKRESFFFIAKPMLPTNLSGIGLPAALDVSFVTGDYDVWNGLAGHYNLSPDFDIYNYEGDLQANGYFIWGKLLQAGGVK